MTDTTETAGIEATIHGGPLHGASVMLLPEEWQKGSFLFHRISRPASEEESVVPTEMVRYTRVHGRPYDFEFVGTL